MGRAKILKKAVENGTTIGNLYYGNNGIFQIFLKSGKIFSNEEKKNILENQQKFSKNFST